MLFWLRLNKWYRGGKNILYSKEDTLSLSTLMMEFPRFLKGKYGETHYQKHIEKFTLRHKLKRRSGFAYISQKESSDFLSFSEDDDDYFFNTEANCIFWLWQTILDENELLKKWDKEKGK